jgi:hypothetical protein
MEHVCRICFGTEGQETMISPCNCRGSSAFIHQDCYERYLEHFPDGVCRVCNAYMVIVKNADISPALGVLGIAVVLLHNAGLPVHVKAGLLVGFIYLLRSLGLNGLLTGRFFLMTAAIAAIVLSGHSVVTIIALNMGLLFVGMCMTLGVYVNAEAAMACVFAIIGYIYLTMLLMRILFETDIWVNVLTLTFGFVGWYGWYMLRQPLMAPVRH